MKYIVLFIVIWAIVIFLLISYILFLFWDPLKFISNIKKHAVLNYREEIVWKDTLSDTDYYFKILNLK